MNQDLDNGKREVAVADSLTLDEDERGLKRKAAFNRDFPELVKAAKRDQLPLAVIMMDLDNFKAINDTHGHPMGDEVLQFVADVIKRNVGVRGIVYGFGGDEFSIVLPNHVADEAASLAERIRKDINDAVIGAQEIGVTASLGVAEIPAHSDNHAGLLKLADDALYEAKDLGHNLVRVSGEPVPERGPRAPKRRVPDLNVFTPVEVEKIQKEYFRYYQAFCPRDGSQLRIVESEFDDRVTPDLIVTCPLCGVSDEIVGVDS